MVACGCIMIMASTQIMVNAYQQYLQQFGNPVVHIHLLGKAYASLLLSTIIGLVNKTLAQFLCVERSSAVCLTLQIAVTILYLFVQMYIYDGTTFVRRKNVFYSVLGLLPLSKIHRLVQLRNDIPSTIVLSVMIYTRR